MKMGRKTNLKIGVYIPPTIWNLRVTLLNLVPIPNEILLYKAEFETVFKISTHPFYNAFFSNQLSFKNTFLFQIA